LKVEDITDAFFRMNGGITIGVERFDNRVSEIFSPLKNATT
jgi:hypothetical protein